jgi:hypothetical protein
MVATAASTQADTYNLAAAALEILDERLAKLAERADRLGVAPMRREVVREFTVEHPVMRERADGRLEDTGLKRLEPRVEVRLVGEPPRLAGWAFLAALEHTDAGTIIRGVPGLQDQVPVQYRTAAAACDHCRTTRPRRDTYVVAAATTGETRQVGSSCLADFLGHANPMAAVWWFQAASRLIADLEDEEGDYHTRVEYGWGLEDVLATAAAVIRGHGWVSRREEEESAGTKVATVEIVRQVLYGTARPRYAWSVAAEARPTDQDRQMAAEARRWVAEELQPTSTYQHNLKTLAQLEVIVDRQFGLTVSMLAIWRQEQARRVERAAQATSRHVGEVGRRQVFTGLTVQHMREQASRAHGYHAAPVTYRYTFIDPAGNLLVWYASNLLHHPAGDQRTVEPGDVVDLRATVKGHELRLPDRGPRYRLRDGGQVWTADRFGPVHTDLTVQQVLDAGGIAETIITRGRVERVQGSAGSTEGGRT